MSAQNQMPQLLLGAGVTASLHPFTYAKVLIQLGHEPLEPIAGKSMFGKPVLTYPNIFRYLRFIREQDGFMGMYRGIAAKLVGGIICNSTTSSIAKYFKDQRAVTPGNLEELDGVDETSALTAWKIVITDTTHETIARCAGIIVSQPFQVIMVRQMAQFIGRETSYDGFFGPLKEIYNNEGILGFFAGLIPRIVCESLTIWMANLLTQAINQYLLPSSGKDMKGYTNGICTLMVTQFTYPFSMIGNVMAANGSGLRGAGPEHSSWLVCWSELSRQNQMKRGSSMFWRRYTGPVVMSYDGSKVPAAAAF